MNILHLDSSITGDASVSRQFSAQIVAKLKAENPSATVAYRDLVANPLGHLTLPAYGEAVSGEVMAEFQAANVLVIGVPMYNFTIPSQLKAWIDRLAVAGQTFKYTDKGPVGLAGDKRVILAVSRGGLYGADTPNSAAEHAVSYLRAVLGFMGMTNIDVVLAEGIAMGPDAKAAGVEAAEKAVAALA